MKRSDIKRNKVRGNRKLAVMNTVMITVITVLIMACVPLGIFAKNYINLSKMSDNNTVQHGKSKGKEKYDGDFGFLILGIDNSGDDDRGLGDARTDSMIYGTFNSHNKTIQMTSIPRDVYTDIYSNGEVVTTEKINSAYTYNKEQSTIETVENWLDVPVDYYATVDFDTFEGVVDAVGGVVVNVPYDMNENFEKDNSGEVLIPKGDNQRLNGKEALIFSRIRKVDDDIKRGERQQEVIQSILNEFMKNPSPKVITDLTESMGDNIKTDMTPDVMMKVAMSLDTNYKIESYVFDWTDFDLNGSSMVDIFDDSRQYISHKFNVNLGEEEKDERDEEDYVFESNEVSELKQQYGSFDGLGTPINVDPNIVQTEPQY